MTQKKSVCRDAGKNLLVVTQKKSACRDAERNLLVVTQKKMHTRAVIEVLVRARGRVAMCVMSLLGT